jgi:hypothetical protein
MFCCFAFLGYDNQDLHKVLTVCSFLICVCVTFLFPPQGKEIGIDGFVAVWSFLLLRLLL